MAGPQPQLEAPPSRGFPSFSLIAISLAPQSQLAPSVRRPMCFFYFLFALSMRLFNIHIHSIARSQARVPEWQRLDLMYDVLINYEARV